MAKAARKRSTPHKGLISPDSGNVVRILEAASLKSGSEAPTFRTRKQREQYQRNAVREFLQRADPSVLMVGPSQRYRIFRKEFEDDPVVKKFSIPSPSFSTFLREEGKKR